MKNTIARMLAMCTESWYILLHTMQMAVVMLLCAFMLLTADAGYEQIKLAAALSETPQGLLLIALIASALLDEKRS